MPSSLVAAVKGSSFSRFIVTGGIAAAVNVGTRWVCSAAMSYEVAVAVAYFVAMTLAFVLARWFVFDASRGRLFAQYVRFAVVNAFAFPQVWLVSVGLVRYLFPTIGFTWNPETVGHVLGVISPVFTSYLGHRYFSFGDTSLATFRFCRRAPAARLITHRRTIR